MLNKLVKKHFLVTKLTIKLYFFIKPLLKYKFYILAHQPHQTTL